MFAIETVIVPFDFSKRSRLAGAHGLCLARRFSAKLVFLHVIPYSNYEYAAYEGGAYIGGAWPREEDIRAKMREQVEAVVGSLGNEVAWEIVIEKGDPPGKITDVARATPHPILVMPTHGFGPFRRFLLGSVTTKVLHDIDAPIYTGTHLEDGPVFADHALGRVACAIDLREHSETVLRWASAFAKSWGAELTVIHAVSWLETAPLEDDSFTPELQERLTADAEQRARALIAKVGCEAELRIDVEPATDYVRQTAAGVEADVLVIGRSPERGMLGRLRDHAFKLIRESPCPVISV